MNSTNIYRYPGGNSYSDSPQINRSVMWWASLVNNALQDIPDVFKNVTSGDLSGQWSYLKTEECFSSQSVESIDVSGAAVFC